MSRSAVIVVALAAACTGTPEPICTLTPFGDPSAAAILEILTTDDGGQSLRPLQGGGALRVNPPPQGGYVAFIGMKARNLDPCAVTMSAELRDESSGQSFGYAERFLNLDATSDGWSSSQPNVLQTFIHLPLCPNRTANPLLGQSQPLVIVVEERSGRRTSTRLPITTECPPDDARCACQCSATYLPGRC